MKRVLILLGFAVAVVVAEPMRFRTPYALQIVSDDTGLGVAQLRVTTDDGTVCRTPGTGTCIWWKSSLMNRDVRFEIVDDTNQFDRLGVTLKVFHGGQATVTVHRES